MIQKRVQSYIYILDQKQPRDRKKRLHLAPLHHPRRSSLGISRILRGTSGLPVRPPPSLDSFLTLASHRSGNRTPRNGPFESGDLSNQRPDGFPFSRWDR